MSDNRLKKWECALALSLVLTLCHGLALPTAAGCNWWGVMFPELTTPAASVRTWSGTDGGGEIQLRCWFLEQLSALRGG